MNKHGSPLLILALVLAMGVLGLFGVSACARDRHAITSAAFPFCLMDDDSGERVTLYFLDGVGDLAFVELGDWQDLLNKIVEDEGDEQGYHLSLDTAGPVATYTRENATPWSSTSNRTFSCSGTTTCS